MLHYEDQEIYRVCPEQIRSAIKRLPITQKEQLEEIRLRQGYPATVLLAGKEEPLMENLHPILVTGDMLVQLLAKATNYSAYASTDYLRQGFVTIPGGHRIGFCGQAVMEHGQVHTIKALSSASIRVARQVKSYDVYLRPLLQQPESLLVIGPPGAGKTSLLRQWTRMLSDEAMQRVSLIDERFEIASCKDGVALFQVGKYTDVLSGCPKAIGIELMLRTMSPQWIIVDEITAAQDIGVMQQAGYCGVRFAASAHAIDRRELDSRPLYRQLLSSDIFRNVLTIDAKRSVKIERL